MDYNYYSNEIQDILEKIKYAHRLDPKTALAHCRKLLKIARAMDDSALFGIAYYNMANSFFSINDYKRFMRFLIKGIPYQQDAKQSPLLARSYNLLAISTENQGNPLSTLDHYFMALKYCEESSLTYETGLVYTNIGHLYTGLKDFRTATKYFRTGLEYFSHTPDNPFYLTNVGLIYIALANCYYNLSNIERSVKYMERYIKSCPKGSKEEKYCRITFSCIYIKILSATNQSDRRDSLITECIAELLKIPSILDIYFEVFDLCEHLMSLEKYTELWIILTRLDEVTKTLEITNLQLHILQLKIEYYKKIQDQDNYLHTVSRYYELSCILEDNKTATTLSTLSLRFSLEEIRSIQEKMKKENLLLQERSERDPLTGLPNRYLLNEYSETAFDRAYQNKTSLAVEIFDVDFFKQFNDTYGHQAGDVCLCKIASILKKIMKDDIFCARYGGDEFVIIYENHTDEEIIDTANSLKEHVLSLKIEHKCSEISPYVTISQGIRNSIPTVTNKLWDYLFAADAALYQVKRSCRNDVFLVHKTVSQNNISSEINFTSDL